jgi:hypothetical protein
VNTSLTSMKFNLAFLATTLAMISIVNGAIAPVVHSQTGGQKTVVSNEDLAPPVFSGASRVTQQLSDHGQKISFFH